MPTLETSMSGMSNSIIEESVFFLNLLLFTSSSIEESIFLITTGDSIFWVLEGYIFFVVICFISWEEDLFDTSRERSSCGSDSLTADSFSSNLCLFLSGLRREFLAIDSSTSITTSDWRMLGFAMAGVVLVLWILADLPRLWDKASFRLLSSSSTSHFPLAFNLFLLSFLNKFISFAVIFNFVLDFSDVFYEMFRDPICCCCIMPFAIIYPKFSPIKMFPPIYCPFFTSCRGGVTFIRWCMGLVEEC